MVKLRATSGRPCSVERWVSQVSVSLGATLMATLISSAVIRPEDRSTFRPELTSGGKFAARAIQPVVYDGLDTMPLPHVAEPRTRSVPLPEFAPALVRRRPSSGRAGLSAPVPSAPAARSTHAGTHVEGRRGTPVPRSVLSTVPGGAERIAAPAPGLDAGVEGSYDAVSPAPTGTRPLVLAKALDAWAAATAAGEDLAAHVLR